MGKAWSALMMVAVLGFIPLLTQSAEAAGRPVIFYACVNAQTGVLYHFQQGKPPHCLAGDRVTSWNQAGLPGPGAVVEDAKDHTVGEVMGTTDLIMDRLLVGLKYR